MFESNKQILIFNKATVCSLLCTLSLCSLFVSAEKARDEAELIPAPQVQLTTVKEQFGRKAHERIKAWETLIADNKGSSEWHNIHRVNSFFNHITFVSDRVHWQKEDYWATPRQFLATNGGDCEDFSIAKYLTLVKLGIPVEKLQLMQVSTQPKKIEHMVVIYLESPTATPLVLDNLDQKIKPIHKRHDLLPSYSFNSEGLWLQQKNGASRKIKDSPGIANWEDVLTRFNDGF